MSALAVTPAEVGAILPADPTLPHRGHPVAAWAAISLMDLHNSSLSGARPDSSRKAAISRWLRNPAGSTPVSTSVTTTQTAGAGLLIGSANRSPTRTSRPTTRGLGMTVGANFALRAPGPEPSLVIGHYGGPTDLIIDVTGYYAPQLAGFVEQDGTLTYSSGRITAVSHPSTGNYDILFDRNVPVSFQVTPYGYNWVTAVGRVGTTKRMSTFTTRLRPSISTTRHSTSWRSAERSPLTNAIGAPSPGEADPGLISEMPRGNTASVPAM